MSEPRKCLTCKDGGDLSVKKYPIGQKIIHLILK